MLVYPLLQIEQRIPGRQRKARMAAGQERGRRVSWLFLERDVDLGSARIARARVVRHAAGVRFRLRPIAAKRRLHPQLPATFPSSSRAPPITISHPLKPCTHLLRPLADPEPPQKVLLGRWDRIRPEADHSPIKLLGEVQRPLGHAQIDMLQRDGHGRFIVPLRRCSLLPYGDYNLA